MISVTGDPTFEAERAFCTWPNGGMEHRFAEWLRYEAEPDDWHRVAEGWNWDQGQQPLLWMVTQPDCDRATALAVFWRGRPAAFLQREEAALAPRWTQPERTLLDVVRDRWRAGLYTRAELAYDPARDSGWLDYPALEREYGAGLARHIPVTMREPLRGRVAEGEPLLDGIPERFWSQDLR